MAAKRPTISFQFLIILLVILALNGSIFFYMLQNVYQQELRAQAQTVVANVEAFGSWVAKNGRIWVKDNPESYLGKLEVTEAENDNNSFHFYSKNPALAQREFSEAVAVSNSPAKFRMTSSNPMNPSNAPDAFEQRALDAVTLNNIPEYAESVDGNYRYAKAVIHTAACISCHGSANSAPNDVIDRYGRSNGFGFKEGDVAGIISVTIPKKNLLGSSVSFFGLVEIIAIIASVLFILWFVRQRIIKPVKELTGVAEQISKGEAVSFEANDIDDNSKNEIDQLKLATSRMATSLTLSMKKMMEYRQTATKATQVARKFKEQLDAKKGE